ncbi:threonine/serine dehydratase [Gephyromycinifex aptenodytis]|uniref:threonine/serine dehydratase n=1 Tax=Gephyromycinifex aptenodytis TaxID=2716227 RepID=UPI0014475A89|nr:threonine/serine dehydratase [Gephyromycinifex aptenodytis]
MLTSTDVHAAAERITGVVRATPVWTTTLDEVAAGLTFKLEMLQHTGTFKARGAANRILAAREQGLLDPNVGIAVASGGNAGLANAWAAARLGVPATVFVPQSAPAAKIRRLQAAGAQVVATGSEYAAAYTAASEHVARTGALHCHAYDQLEICAGAGTLASELLAQTDRQLDTVIVAVGGGGLMAGVAAALDQQDISVVGVEPSNAPTLHSALAAGEPVDVSVGGVAADSLGARRVGDIAFEVARRRQVTSVLVTDEAITHARRLLWERWRLVVEHGAATPLAALLAGAYRPDDGERVAVVLCGANTDPTDL